MLAVQLEEYFDPIQANALKNEFCINSMEQLLSLDTHSKSLDGIAEAIGMDEKTFYIIIKKAKNNIPTPKHSGRRYPLGVLLKKML